MTEPPTGTGQPHARSGWTFLTNHALVLLAVARDPHATLRAMAGQVGITERAIRLVVRDLQAAGYLTVARVGRRNTYRINENVRLRHPMAARQSVRALLSILR